MGFLEVGFGVLQPALKPSGPIRIHHTGKIDHDMPNSEVENFRDGLIYSFSQHNVSHFPHPVSVLYSEHWF